MLDLLHDVAAQELVLSLVARRGIEREVALGDLLRELTTLHNEFARTLKAGKIRRQKYNIGSSISSQIAFAQRALRNAAMGHPPWDERLGGGTTTVYDYVLQFLKDNIATYERLLNKPQT